jgi:hypothetical protein
MTRRYLTVLLVVLLAGGGTSAVADPRSDLQGSAETHAGGTVPAPGVRLEQETHDKLRADVSRLLADARAGRVGTTIEPRQQPVQSNNLSKRAKVTIAVVVVAVVITAVVIASKANDSPGSIRIF